MKCFLSFTESSSVARVSDILRASKISILDVYDIVPGRTIVDSIKQKIGQSDFAIFILSQASESMLFEIGVCEGIGKPYMLILDKSFDLPGIFNASRWIRMNETNQPLLKLAIQNFIHDLKSQDAEVQNKGSFQTTIIRTADTGPRIDAKRDDLERILEQIPQIRREATGLETERFVERILTILNIKFVPNITNQAETTGVDFAIWNDKIGKTIGNPILLEVKGGNLSRPRFVETSESELLKFANASDAKVAILLYLDRSGRRFKFDARLEPLLIAYDIEDFVSELKKVSFERLILNARNRIAHGV